MPDCTPSGLANLAKCFCFDIKTQLAVQTYLLCQILARGGAAIQVYSGTGDPNGVLTPEDTAIANLYIQTDNGQLWQWPAGGSSWS